MGITLREKIKQMPPEHQEKIRKRSAELMAEEKVRQQLRQLFKITQDKRGQFTLFKQWNYLESSFKLFAEFPKRPPINLRINDQGQPPHFSYLQQKRVSPNPTWLK